MLGIFLDTEANGLNPHVHKILELAFKIIDLTNGQVKAEYQSIISQSLESWEKSDPESLRITGFSWNEVQERGRAGSLVSQQIIDLFKEHHIRRKQAIFICQNPSFDRAYFSQLLDPETQELLNIPYHWLDLASMFWAHCMDKAKQKLGPFPWEIGVSKDMIASYYRLPLEGHPHRAMNGVNHLLLCYQAVVGFPVREK